MEAIFYRRLKSPHTVSMLGVLCVFVVNSFVVHSWGADWYHWRGPWQTGVSPETDLPDKWSTDPADPNNNLIWRAPYGCRSTPLVMNGRVYLINSAGQGITEQERVMCLDADTGKPLWEHRFNVWHADIVSNRLGWANLAGDPKTGSVYAHGTQGMLFGFDKDGKVLWSHSLIEEYGRFTGYGGRVTTPTVDEDQVIIGMVNSNWGDQKGGNRWLSLDKQTGTPLWWAEPIGPPKDSYYSVPVVGVINGERLLIGGGAAGQVVAMKARTGEKVWTYPLSVGSLNSAPVLDGNLVYAAQGMESPDSNVQGRIVCLDASKVTKGRPKLVWHKDGIEARFASPVIHAGRLFVADDTARLHGFDALTGQNLFKRFVYGREARGAPVFADGRIYIGEVDSRFVILKPGPKKCTLLHEHVFPSSDKTAAVEVNGTPAIANGRVYFSTSEEIYCIGKKGAKPAAEPRSTLKEEPAPADAKIAHLQVVPADLIIYPGESAAFKVKGYDDKGRYLREVKAEWSLPALPAPKEAKKGLPALKGMIEDGKLTVSKNVVNQQGFVQAMAGGLTAMARVRVPPKPPYFDDFERYPLGSVPPGWVNCQGKYVIAELKGNKVLKKVNTKTSPLVSRGNTYFGMPSLTDYTIESDVMGSKVGSDMPDIGIVANRYMLSLAGAVQKLRISSWEAIPRLDQTRAFTWQPDQWYRLKLTVDVQKDQAVIRGKVWPRDEKEPEAWTIRAADPSPNREGSPALYGYVIGIAEGDGGHPGTEVYYDNVRLTANK